LTASVNRVRSDSQTPEVFAVSAHTPPENAEIADILDALDWPGIVTLHRIANNARDEDFATWLKDRRNRRQIPHRMEGCGYVPVRNADAEDGLWKLMGRRQAVYGKAEMSIEQ
jgi:hypothetical protein